MTASHETSAGDWLNQLLDVRDPMHPKVAAEKGAKASADSGPRSQANVTTNGQPTQPQATSELTDRRDGASEGRKLEDRTMSSSVELRSGIVIRITTRGVCLATLLILSHTAAFAIGYRCVSVATGPSEKTSPSEKTGSTEKTASTSATNAQQTANATPTPTPKPTPKPVESPKAEAPPANRPSPWSATEAPSPQPAPVPPASSSLGKEFLETLHQIRNGT